MLPDALGETLQRVWTTLRAVDVPLAVMGGIALSRWERVRATKDIDLLAGIEPMNVDSTLKKLREVKVRCEHQPPIRNIGGMQFIHLLFEPPGAFIEVRTDLLLASTEFLRLALSRRVPMQIPQSNSPHTNFEVEVVTCEDLILLKLQAGRMIDLADAAELLWTNRAMIDLDYLSQWVKQFHLDMEWRQVWAEALPGEFPPPPSV